MTGKKQTAFFTDTCEGSKKQLNWNSFASTGTQDML
jgi:hypothetical protein